MTDALGARNLYRFIDVVAEVFRGNESGGQFAGMESKMASRIDTPQAVENLHLLVKIMNCHIRVFRLHQIQAEHQLLFTTLTSLLAIFLGHGKANDDSGQHLREIDGARDLIEVTNFHRATRLAMGLIVTVQQCLPAIVELSQVFQGRLNRTAEVSVFFEVPGQIRDLFDIFALPSGGYHVTDFFRSFTFIQSEHQLQIAFILGGSPPDDLGKHLGRM